MSRITYVIHNLTAMAISAEAVARTLRANDLRKAYELVCPDGEIWKCLAYQDMAVSVAKSDAQIPNVGFLKVRPYLVHSTLGDKATIPNWQPVMSFGFQGRQLIVVAEIESVRLGVPSGKRTYQVVALGNDGEVRSCLDAIVAGAIAGDVHAHRIGYPASIAAVEAMIDHALSHAVPSSFFHDIETVTSFALAPIESLESERRARLELYDQAGVAPMLLDEPELADPEWTVHWTLLPDESLYALCEVYGGKVCNVTGASNGRKNRTDGAQFLANGYHHWTHGRIAA